jgi:molecular chaperone DnaJ
VTVATLDGERAIELEPGTQPGSVLVLRGKGMPNLRSGVRGDHRLLVDVVIPRRLTPEQRASLERFERSATEETYQPEESLFDRIKGAFR